MGSVVTTTSDTSVAVNRARVAAANSTNATSVKPGPGNVYGFYLSATAASASTAFLKLFDKASAPTLGTDVPVLTIPIISTTTLAGMAQFISDIGIPFFNGIAYAITLNVADNDTTAVAANAVHGVILYK